VFVDARLPLLDNRVRFNGGFRFDWARTAVSTLEAPLPGFPGNPTVSVVNPTTPGAYQPQSPTGASPFGAPVAFSGSQLEREFALWAGFLTAEWDMTDNLHWVASYGHAQRPPTLAELYALNPIVGVIQNGLTTVLGQPLLAPETVDELSLSVIWRSDRYRAGLNGFYAMVHNYITYQQIFPTAFAGVPSYQFLNTHEARLDGAEAYAEADVRPWLTLFATAAYVQGRDLTVDGRLGVNPTTLALVAGPRTEALPSIPPLDTHVGLRFHDPRPERRWATEIGIRIVAPQEEVATSLSEVTTAGFCTGDIRTYWRPNNNWLLTAGIENFWDRNYREHLDLIIPPGGIPQGVFQPGITFYMGARLTY
jgi:iron complex outermembrane receptor protein